MEIKCPISGKLIRSSKNGPSGFESRFLSEFEELGVIGSGGYGSVVKCVNKVDNQEYAVKKVLLDTEEGLDYDLVISEVLCLAVVCHENVIRYYSAWFEAEIAGAFDLTADSGEISCETGGPCLYIQQEICSTSLNKVLEAESFLKDEHVWDIFSQIVKGLQHIHSKGIRHGDLKPSNIFMTGERIVKIGDFGLGSFLAGRVKVPIARGYYVAPELTAELPEFPLESDIFSLGMILFEMFDGFGFGTTQERYEVLGNSEKRGEYLEKSSLDIKKKDLIKVLISEEFTKRPSTSEILELLKDATSLDENIETDEYNDV